ncbi:MAG: TonB family protein [Terracidiphilus sp.]
MGNGSIRREWEGLVVDGTFALLEWLGGNEDRGVFLTVRHGTQRAAIKLIAASGTDADEYLAQWKAARNLSHPSLTPVLETGRSAIAGTDLVYVVTELAEGSLSQTIQRRALRAGEAKKFFDPVLDALSYLHEMGFIHGHVKPSNILLAANQVKLSGDDFFVTDGVAKRAWKPSAYDAPEVASGTLSETVDSWSVGISLVEAMTQHLPTREAEALDEPVVPDSLPTPFYEVVRECFRIEPDQRCTMRNIQARLDGEGAPATGEETVAVVEDQVPAAAENEAVVEKQNAAPVEPIDETESDQEAPLLFLRTGIEDTYLTKRSKWPIAIGLAALLAVAAVLLVRGDNYKRVLPLLSQIERAVMPAKQPAQSQAASGSGAANAPATSDVANSEAAPTSAPAQPASSDGAQSLPGTGQAAPEPQPPAASTDGAAGGDASEAPKGAATGDGTPPSASPQAVPADEPHSAPADGQGEAKPEMPTARVSHVMNADGEVASRVLPHVSQYAISSMDRPEEVVIRVSVNRRGEVSSAEYVSPGPGNYFARVAQQAAKSWRFKPPVREGEAEPSVWTLRFHFWRTELEASAEEMGS